MLDSNQQEVFRRDSVYPINEMAQKQYENMLPMQSRKERI